VTTAVALGELAITLGVTIALELLAALFFKVGRRGLIAVALVSVVTNPALNVLMGYMSGAYWFDHPRRADAAIILAEIAVVFVEWALLVWALRRTAGSPRKLLVLSIAMNLVSWAGYYVAVMIMTMIAFAAFPQPY